MRIQICWEGKTKDPHLRALITEYLRRTQRFADIRLQELRDSRRAQSTSGVTANRRRLLEQHQDACKVILDSRGRRYSSGEWAKWLGKHALGGTKELLFIVGGPDGVPATFRETADLSLSLSQMTLTHEWARALLLEQLYRGFASLKGHPYPR